MKQIQFRSEVETKPANSTQFLPAQLPIMIMLHCCFLTMPLTNIQCGQESQEMMGNHPGFSECWQNSLSHTAQQRPLWSIGGLRSAWVCDRRCSVMWLNECTAQQPADITVFNKASVTISRALL